MSMRSAASSLRRSTPLSDIFSDVLDAPPSRPSLDTNSVAMPPPVARRSPTSHQSLQKKQPLGVAPDLKCKEGTPLFPVSGSSPSQFAPQQSRQNQPLVVGTESKLEKSIQRHTASNPSRASWESPRKLEASDLMAESKCEVEWHSLALGSSPSRASQQLHRKMRPSGTVAQPKFEEKSFPSSTLLKSLDTRAAEGIRHKSTQLEALSSTDGGIASVAATKTEIMSTQSECVGSPPFSQGTEQLLADLDDILADGESGKGSAGALDTRSVGLGIGCSLSAASSSAPVSGFAKSATSCLQSPSQKCTYLGKSTMQISASADACNVSLTGALDMDPLEVKAGSPTPSSPPICWWEMPLDHIKSVDKRRDAKGDCASPSPTRKRKRIQGTTDTVVVPEMLSGNVGLAGDAAEGTSKDSDGDGWFERLMKRRAERNTDERQADERHKDVEGMAKVDATKAATKAARCSAVEAIQAQLAQLAHVRAAAETAGWLGGFSDEPQSLEPAPPAAIAAAMRLSKRTAKGIRAAGGVKGQVRGSAQREAANSLSELTQVLPTLQLPVDVACAARASDAFHNEQQTLLTEVARAHRRSRSDGPEAEEEALAILQNLRQRVKEEPGRRALMRSCGVCPRAAVFEKASIGRSGEGKLFGQTIANEFEAKTFLPSAQLGDRIEAVRPGYLGEWHVLDEGHVELLCPMSGPKDFAACAEVASRLGARTTGYFVGRLAQAGLTKDYPFLIKSGLSHFVCGACEQWVSRQDARRHNMRCVGDAAGRAHIFQQSCAEGLGVTLNFKHLQRLGVVELQAEASVEAAIRRACWACYWAPDDLRCAWRLARHPDTETNVFPRNDPVDVNAPRAVDGSKVAGETDSAASGDAADVATEGCSARKKRKADHFLSATNAEEGNIFAGEQLTPAIQARPTPPRFSLQSSYKAPQTQQPWSFVRPLTDAQLHTLGWMKQREDCEDTYVSTQILREKLAESDVCLEVRLERDFRNAHGGILADALGYGKTACTIALIAETRQQSLQELLDLDQWPKIAGQRVLTNATLVVTPPNLFDQWLREIRKFVVSTSGLKVLAVPSHSKLKNLTVADFVAADIVLVSFRFFFSEAYQRYFDELTKPGLKVWDEVSVQRRDAFCKRRKAVHVTSKGDKKQQESSNIEQLQRAAQSLGVSLPSSPTERGQEAETAMPTPSELQTGCWPSLAAKTEIVPDTGIVPESYATDVHGQPSRLDGSVQESVTPALQLSKYYLEMRASKDYLPQRYLDLERRTKRTLREAKTAEELAQSPALFEMFYFKRVVFDEFHEVVQMSSQQSMAASSTAKVPFYALHALQGRCHWGLTATPFLSSAAAVARMASLLRVFVPCDDEAEAQRFLDTWITSNTWDDSGIPLKEHWVEVELTVLERALYIHQHKALQEQGSHAPDNNHARAAERRLLRLCSDFDPESGSEQHAADACEALRHEMTRLRGLLEHAIARQRFCEAQREELVTRWYARDQLQAALPDNLRESTLACAHCELSELHSLTEGALHASDARLTAELALVEADLRRLAQAAVDGQPPAVTPHVDGACEPCRHLGLCEERLKHFNRSKGQAQGDQRQAETQLRFLEAIFDSLEASDAMLECPACLRDASPSKTTILPCGHRLHVACATEAISVHGCCPECNWPASLQTCTNVAELLKYRASTVPEDSLRAVGSGVAEELSRTLHRQFGSKQAKVVETIQDIQRKEGEATKCIVFIQWDGISSQLESALKAAGISPLMLRGHASQRQKTIARFMDSHTADTSVLLLSLEHSPSGMNLACAHHVLLVHPMHADRCEEAADYEKQAIGRVRRRGQDHTVHTYRFVARGTVEEALAHRHVALCQQPRPATAAGS